MKNSFQKVIRFTKMENWAWWSSNPDCWAKDPKRIVFAHEAKF
jgi:hypothetical protein